MDCIALHRRGEEWRGELASHRTAPHATAEQRRGEGTVNRIPSHRIASHRKEREAATLPRPHHTTPHHTVPTHRSSLLLSSIASPNKYVGPGLDCPSTLNSGRCLDCENTAFGLWPDPTSPQIVKPYFGPGLQDWRRATAMLSDERSRETELLLLESRLRRSELEDAEWSTISGRRRRRVRFECIFHAFARRRIWCGGRGGGGGGGWGGGWGVGGGGGG